MPQAARILIWADSQLKIVCSLRRSDSKSEITRGKFPWGRFLDKFGPLIAYLLSFIEQELNDKGPKNYIWVSFLVELKDMRQGNVVLAGGADRCNINK